MGFAARPVLHLKLDNFPFLPGTGVRPLPFGESTNLSLLTVYVNI